MGHVATIGGITAEDVRDLIVATVEHRFGPVNRLAEPLEWLTDNPVLSLSKGAAPMSPVTLGACARHRPRPAHHPGQQPAV